MTAKHRKRDGYGGTLYSRGPKRWGRAASNALCKPTSKGGQLYLRRVVVAQTIHEGTLSQLSVAADTKWEFTKFDCNTGSGKRDFVCCTVFCAVMCAQLEGTENSLEGVRKFFSETHKLWRGYDSATKSHNIEDTYVPKVRPLDVTTLTRNVRCQYCGSEVKKGK